MRRRHLPPSPWHTRITRSHSMRLPRMHMHTYSRTYSRTDSRRRGRLVTINYHVRVAMARFRNIRSCRARGVTGLWRATGKRRMDLRRRRRRSKGWRRLMYMRRRRQVWRRRLMCMLRRRQMWRRRRMGRRSMGIITGLMVRLLRRQVVWQYRRVVYRLRDTPRRRRNGLLICLPTSGGGMGTVAVAVVDMCERFCEEQHVCFQ